MGTVEVNKSENFVDGIQVWFLINRTHRNPSVLPIWKFTTANNRMRVAAMEILIPLMTTERLGSDGCYTLSFICANYLGFKHALSRVTNN